MQIHPIIRYVPYRIAGIASVAVCSGIGSLLLYYYTEAEWWSACLDSLVSVAIFSVCGFLLWYVTGILRPFQARLALLLFVQLVCLAGGYMAELLTGQYQVEWFSATIPFRLLFGVLGWIILAQWYYIRWKEQQEKKKEDEEQIQTQEDMALLPQSEDPKLDYISVKDGTRIHLIQLDELFYIQASGDYVTLFTSTGQYVKMQTMKYFETHLPENSFIRIHRSCIVNCKQIIRVELFGKDSYQVRLKAGGSLRISSAGYKLLKERLFL